MLAKALNLEPRVFFFFFSCLFGFLKVIKHSRKSAVSEKKIAVE